MSSTLTEEAFDQPSPRLSVAALDRQQAIQADYYMLTNVEGGPAAVLLVLLDRSRTPVRAELHLYADASDDEREYSFRQGRTLLERRYASAELVPLQILESEPLGDMIQVRTEGTNIVPVASTWQPNRQVLAGLGLFVLLFLLIWVVWSWVGNTAPNSETPTTASEVTPVEAPAATTPLAVEAGQTLPPSARANPNLAIGKRIRVLPNLQVSLVAAPSADQPAVGYLQNQQEATIIDGPVLTQGKSDTIVWWRIRLDDGSEAWAPANTSDVTLLELAE